MTTGAELVQQLTEAYQPYQDAASKIQEIAYQAVITLAKEAWPHARYLSLTSSDQSYDYGWWLQAVCDAEGEEIPNWEADRPEDIDQPLSDLNWKHPHITERAASDGEIDLQVT